MSDTSSQTGAPGPAPFALWFVYAAAVFAGTFEAIAVHGTVSGLRPTGSYMGLIAFLIVGIGVAVSTSSGAARRQRLAKGAIATSVVAIVAALAIPSRIAEVQGALPSGVPVGQAALLFLFQLGWATTYWLTVSRRSTANGRHIPAAIGTVLLVGGGFLLSQRSEPVAAVPPENVSAVFVQSPSEEELAFATQTATAGGGDRLQIRTLSRRVSASARPELQHAGVVRPPSNRGLERRWSSKESVGGARCTKPVLSLR